jgi:hypothetical protein
MALTHLPLRESSTTAGTTRRHDRVVAELRDPLRRGEIGRSGEALEETTEAGAQVHGGSLRTR